MLTSNWQYYIIHIIGSKYVARVDSQTKCKFCTNTESCMEHEEWEPTTVTHQQSSIRVDQAQLSDHLRPSLRSAFATTTSFRMMAVSATLGGLPALTSWSYFFFELRSWRIVQSAGMYIARRKNARPPRIRSLPCHWPDWREMGASPARHAACLPLMVPSSTFVFFSTDDH